MNPRNRTNSDENLTLVIETAIAGGSLALFGNGFEIDSWIGSEEVSKAEDVLEQIDELLEKNKIKKTRLNLIKVSSGPGSSTGLKIGLAIAKGLAGALGIRVETVSAAAALLTAADFDKKKVLTILPVGKSLFFSRFYEKGADGSFKLAQKDTEASNFERLQKILESVDFEQLIFHPKSFEIASSRIRLTSKKSSTIKISTDNLAVLIANSRASDNEPKFCR